MSRIGLLPLHGLAGSPIIPLVDGELALGRDPGPGGVKIADPRCSRRHAIIRHSNGVVSVTDLRSKNGTWVNGDQIAEVNLQKGDHVRIGHAEFAFTVEGDAYRCASCMQTLVIAPPEAPFCTECRRGFPLLGATLGDRRLVRGPSAPDRSGRSTSATGAGIPMSRSRSSTSSSPRRRTSS